MHTITKTHKEQRKERHKMEAKGKTKKGRTVILLKKHTPDAAKWVRWLEENCQASAGPHGNLTGMRNLYWGREALVVRAGAYLYLITSKDDGRMMPWE